MWLSLLKDTIEEKIKKWIKPAKHKFSCGELIELDRRNYLFSPYPLTKQVFVSKIALLSNRFGKNDSIYIL